MSRDNAVEVARLDPKPPTATTHDLLVTLSDRRFTTRKEYEPKKPVS